MIEPRSSKRSVVLHAQLGVLAVVLIAGGLGWWSLSTRIAGAVVAGGVIVVEGGPKRVQHPEGGVVTKILVRDEDRVTAGDVLVRLDGITVEASLSVVRSQLRDAYAREARLLAEAAGGAAPMPSPGLPHDLADAEFDRLLAMQADLLRSRAASLAGQRSRVAEQIIQLDQQIAGLAAQLEAARVQQQLMSAERTDQQKLLDDGLVAKARINELRRADAQLAGDLGRLTASIAEARARIAEQRLMLVQLDDDNRSEVLKELQASGAEIAQLLQQRIAVEDRLTRLVIRAPQTGIVHASTVVTVGGVVNAGETLMLIVPALDRTIVDVRISPFDIDKIFPAQDVTLRFTSLQSANTPDLGASISSIAPDLTTDPRSGVQYYLARVAVAPGELARLPVGTRLVPGMPAEAFVRTGDRTVLAYLVKPLMDQIERAFRED